jgi:hypothetical protein
MSSAVLAVSVIVLVSLGPFILPAQTLDQTDEYFTWNASRAESIGKSTRINGRVGGLFDFRVVHTERSYNYKLRATWLTPEVIRASARLQQLRQRLSTEQTRALVAEAEAISGTVIMIEIDPREGSGVIPLEWMALLGSKGKPGKEVQGTITQELRNVKGLAGVVSRDYDYDIFWAVFPLRRETGEPIIDASDREVELVVSIYNKEGRVDWSIPNSIRAKLGNPK